MRQVAILVACALAVAGLTPADSVRAQEYRLGAGDVLDFSIVGTENFQQRVPVSIDGNIRLPIGGQFKAAGRTVDDVRNDVVDTLKSSSYPAGVDPQGNTVWNVIYPEGVVLSIAEYRPVYLSGDVLTPGAQAFRFGLTVRQAAAVAGGYSMFRNRTDYSLEMVGVEQEYQSYLAQYVKAELNAVRIRAELDGATAPDFAGVPAAGLDPALRRTFEDLERQQFESRISDREKERQNINEGIENAQARYSYLIQSKTNLEAETKNYEAELKRVEELLRKGLTQVARLNDAQRAVFLVATRSLETSAEVARIERELVELRRSLEKVDSDSRMENLTNLQNATLSISGLRAQLDETSRKRDLFLPSTTANGRPVTPRIVITRLEGDSSLQIDAKEDTALQPGDTVEIAMGGGAAEAAAAPPVDAVAANARQGAASSPPAVPTRAAP